jgi:hypothetical protein
MRGHSHHHDLSSPVRVRRHDSERRFGNRQWEERNGKVEWGFNRAGEWTLLVRDCNLGIKVELCYFGATRDPWLAEPWTDEEEAAMRDCEDWLERRGVAQ